MNRLKYKILKEYPELNLISGYCRFCRKRTKTIKRKGLSASENIHYHYYCKDCGWNKE